MGKARGGWSSPAAATQPRTSAGRSAQSLACAGFCSGGASCARSSPRSPISSSGLTGLPRLAARFRAYVDVFALAAEQAEDLDRLVTRGPEPVREPRVELCDFAGFHRDVVVSKDQSQLP